LYFTMLNCNKRSLTLNLKAAQGKEILNALIKRSDIMVENFGPGVLDRQDFTWEHIRAINPRIIYASIKGFGPGPFHDSKAYETIAQAMGGAMSTTGWENGPPTSSGAQIGDSGTGIHAVAAILAALYQRIGSGRGQRVEVAMQDAVLNLCRVKLRDQQRLAHGTLPEYPNRTFGDSVPRSGNASGGGQPGSEVRCAPCGPNDYCYVIIQPQIWPALARTIGRPELADDPAYSTPEARLTHLDEVFKLVEQWTLKHTKHEVMRMLMEVGVPCGPIMSTRDLIEDEALNRHGMIVEVPHQQRGTFKTVGCPLMLSDSPVEVKTAPLLGEHTVEVLREVLGYSEAQVRELRTRGVV
ncbi:MAG: formyl-CoA transferase, partial [Candidatus Binataceae bacterium]